jgi:hypothetical protein
VSAELDARPPREGARFRAIIGLLVLLGGLICVVALFFVPIPDGNKEAVILAIGVVLGWGGTVVSYEFGSSPSGRKAAEAGIRANSNQ